jgi:hypothetical protein
MGGLDMWHLGKIVKCGFVQRNKMYLCFLSNNVFPTGWNQRYSQVCGLLKARMQPQKKAWWSQFFLCIVQHNHVYINMYIVIQGTEQ